MRLSSFAIPILSASATFALSNLHRPYRRTTVPVTCGSLNSDLVLNDVVDSNGKATVAGHIAACLCLTDVEQFVESNPVAQKAVQLLGDQAKVEALISDMVSGLPTAAQCSYPDHARALCTDSNPCDFECTDGFLPFPAERPTSCICPDYLTECNGQCVPSKDCPIKPPPSRRNNDPHCADGLTMCGVPGKSTGQPWKCVDVTTDPTTCGGCVAACPFGNAPVNGVNCKEIKGVIPDTVTCGNGRCIVKECAKGYYVSPASDTCIPMSEDATASSEQQGGATIPGTSGSTESTEGLKSSPRGLNVPSKHVAGTSIASAGGLKTGDVIDKIEHGTGVVVVEPIVRAFKRFTTGGHGGPVGVVARAIQGTKVVSSAAGAVQVA